MLLSVLLSLLDLHLLNPTPFRCQVVPRSVLPIDIAPLRKSVYDVANNSESY